MTPALALASAREQIVEPNAAFYTDLEIYQYMTNAELILAKKVRCYETTDATGVTAATTREYAIPTGAIQITRLTYDYFPLKQIDQSELDSVENVAYGYTGNNANPVYYYRYGTSVGLSPIPTAVKTLKYWFIGTPATITAASTTFSIPAHFGHYLVDYCLYRMYLKDDMHDKAKLHLQLWNENLAKANEEWQDIKRGDRIQVIKDEDSMNMTDMGMV